MLVGAVIVRNDPSSETVPSVPPTAAGTARRGVMSARERSERTMHALEEALQAEPRDPEWADATEAAVRALPHTHDLGAVSIEQAECRATICRVIVGGAAGP